MSLQLLLKYIDNLELRPHDPLLRAVADLPPPPDKISRDANTVFELKLERLVLLSKNLLVGEQGGGGKRK